MNANSTDIPVVDIGSHDAAERVLQAACEHGFIFIKHRDLDLTPASVDEMFEASRQFFAAPQEVKAECAINSKKSGKNHGWLSMNAETLDPKNQKKGDFKEGFNIGEYHDGHPQQPFPKPLQAHQTAIGDFMMKCHMLCDKLLQLLAISLRIPDSEGGQEWFSERHNRRKGPSGSILRFLYYPTLPAWMANNSNDDIRAGAHSDYGSITLLFRLPSQPGLEIQKASGAWAPVPTNPNASASSTEALPILVNIGDLLSYWTNGLLKSTVHRVIFPKDTEQNVERYSIAYFCHPEDDAKLVPIPSEVVGNASDGHESHNHSNNVMTARDHLNSRLAATYNIG